MISCHELLGHSCQLLSTHETSENRSRMETTSHTVTAAFRFPYAVAVSRDYESTVCADVYSS